jgi:hypothetical protein
MFAPQYSGGVKATEGPEKANWFLTSHHTSLGSHEVKSRPYGLEEMCGDKSLSINAMKGNEVVI